MNNEEEWRSVHEVLLIVLPYLHSLYELLSMTRVSRSLRNAIRDETALWNKIVVEPPLSSRLTDEILSEIAMKSAGNLKTLILRQCRSITDNSLRPIVDSNPLITKIIVPGCMDLSPEGIIGCVERLTRNNHKVETLHVSRVYGVTKQHISELLKYVPQEGIDVEVCPKCDEVRIVPACSRKSCKESKERKCKGCRFCVPRCVECLVCLGSDIEIQEAACGGDVLCLECWLVLPKCRFCNRPYCTSHSGLRQEIETTDDAARPVFECQACYYRAGTNPYDAFDYQI